MPEIRISDFSAGWSPQDDPINGRKNALLQMDSIELDQLGALKLCGGTKNILNFSYPADAHTLYSRFISGIQVRYLGLTNGAIYRDTANIITGGSTTRAAFLAAFNYIFIFSGTQRFRDSGTAVTVLGLLPLSAPSATAGMAGNLNGQYQWALLSVFNAGNGYLAKSPLSAASNTLNLTNQSAQVTLPPIPAAANETWVFRRGGNLDQWYRVAVSTVIAGETINDNLGDEDALLFGISTNIFLTSTNPVGLPQDILTVIGLINQRAILFTKNTIIFSELNSPDTYDSRNVINYAGNQSSGSEIFLWAKKVSEATILVGTTQDVYSLTGTFKTLPDDTIDVLFRPMGVKFPPIGIDADVYGNSIVYFSNVGWIQLSLDSSFIPLCPPNTDRLYRGESLNGYGGTPIFVYPNTDVSGVQLRYSCAVARNKLWCRVPQIQNNDFLNNPFTYRMEVYDFIRKYWRPLLINSAPIILYAQEDGAIMGFFSDSLGRNLREIDNQFQKVNEGNQKQQVNILTTFQDAGLPFNRKETYTLKLRINTGASPLNCYAFVNNDYSFSNPILIAAINTATSQEVFFDINSLVGITKNIALKLTGQVNNLILEDISILYEQYPEAKTFFNALIPNRLNKFQKGRFLLWPIVIDTLGLPVTFTPYLDGVALPAQIINTTSKRTAFYISNISQPLGIDLNFKLSGNLFELWEVGQPEIVNTLPFGKFFDQIGPSELFRYGKLRQFYTRLLPLGDVIPYNIYFQDGSNEVGSLVTIPNVEDIYLMKVKKTTAGEVIKITFGPTNFLFHHYYTRLQFAHEGKDTENDYIILPGEQQQ